MGVLHAGSKESEGGRLFERHRMWNVSCVAR